MPSRPWLLIGPAGPALTDDPLLRELVAAAMDRRPELAQARAQIAAEQERVPQSRVLPDPMLSLGIQNDGFRGILIGKMESNRLYHSGLLVQSEATVASTLVQYQVGRVPFEGMGHGRCL